MAAYRRVYDSRHLQADCQEPGSAPEPYARKSSMGYVYLFLGFASRTRIGSWLHLCSLWKAVAVAAVSAAASDEENCDYSARRNDALAASVALVPSDCSRCCDQLYSVPSNWLSLGTVSAAY